MGSPFHISVWINRKWTKMFFCFWWAHPQALAEDALTMSLENLYAYVYPPIYPIPKILQYIRQLYCQNILIAHQWSRRHWYTELLQFWFLYQSIYQFETTCYINHKYGCITHNLWFSILILGCYRQRYLSKCLYRKRHTQNYSSKFKKFNSWCKSMKIDPYSASLKETADLLAFFLMKGCNTEQLQTIVQCYQFSFRRLIIYRIMLYRVQFVVHSIYNIAET
jgi:hypothetical protein